MKFNVYDTDKNFTEKGSVTTNHTFKYCGRGMDVQSIFREYETKFSIAKGIIKVEEPTDKFYEIDDDGIHYRKYTGPVYFNR